MAAFSGRLGKDWLGVWARVRQHGQKTEGRMCTAFVEACWLEDGLFGPGPAARTGDAEHTFYGLLALGTCRNNL